MTKTGGKRHGSAMTALATTTLIALATGYPYEFPACSYLFADHARHPLPDDLLAELTGRIPVIACGSNRAPEQLARKFQDWPLPLRIPVLCAKLAGFDVVYSAHFTRYGAVPATLHPSPAPPPMSPFSGSLPPNLNVWTRPRASASTMTATT